MKLEKNLSVLLLFLIISKVNSHCSPSKNELLATSDRLNKPHDSTFASTTSIENQNNMQNLATNTITVTTIIPSKKTNLLPPTPSDSKIVKVVENLMHTTVYSSTTTIPYGSCKTISGSSRVYGSTRVANGTLILFSVQLSKLKAIKIYSGKNVNSFTATFDNGDTFTAGNFSNKDVKTSFEVNLENKEVVAVVIHEFTSINGITFLLHDLLNDTYTWTKSMGSYHGNGGYQTINQDTFLLNKASDFKITTISGKTDNNYVKTLQFGYSCKICNPYASKVVGSTLPTPNTDGITTTFDLMTKTSIDATGF